MNTQELQQAITLECQAKRCALVAMDSTTTTCQQVGYVAPRYNPGTPGGIERRSFRYQLDCKGLTFDRKGDFDGFGNKGWMGVDSDPTAKAVADGYCSAIESLPKEGNEED